MMAGGADLEVLQHELEQASKSGGAEAESYAETAGAIKSELGEIGMGDVEGDALELIGRVRTACVLAQPESGRSLVALDAAEIPVRQRTASKRGVFTIEIPIAVRRQLPHPR